MAVRVKTVAEASARSSWQTNRGKFSTKNDRPQVSVTRMADGLEVWCQRSDGYANEAQKLRDCTWDLTIPNAH